MALNIITAKFCAGATQAWASEAWQYDYGQVLQFDGVELPEAYQVHFSNEPMTGETITQIGNADGVSVPDQFFQSGETVYAWVYLHEGEDDGETVYMVTIPVKKRPQPSDEVPTPVEQSAIDQAIAALNIAVEKADEAITHYPTIIDGTWHVWDVTTGEYVDTGVEAQGDPGTPGAPGTPGEDGFSPTVTVTEITGGHRVAITDESGEHTFDVMDGQGGSAITVDPAMSSTSENPVQNKVIDAEITGLKDNLNNKADVIISSASGSIAHFEDGAAADAVSVIAHFEPEQDLHGYDSPWPAGGGVNVLDPNIKFTAGTYYGGMVISTSDGYNITMTGTPTESGNITTNSIPTADAIVMPAGTYTSTGAIFSTYKPDGSWYTNRQIGTWTADSDFIIRNAYIQAVANKPASGSRFISLVKGSTAPTSWTPYSNICPISGFTGMDVVVSPTTNAQDGTTYPITFPSEAGTVYGGYVDVTRGKVVQTWEFTSNIWGNIKTGITFESTDLAEGSMSSVHRIKATHVQSEYGVNSLSNILRKIIWNNGSLAPAHFYSGNVNNRGVAYIYLPTATPDNMIIQFAFALETPIEYDITPQQIALLKGYNNVWNSAGGNNEVQYRADTKLYIDGKQLDFRNTIAPIEDGDTASQAYAVGRYFYRNGAFCKAKTAIASGAAFTLNTNYEVTTVSAELYTALH